MKTRLNATAIGVLTTVSLLPWQPVAQAQASSSEIVDALFLNQTVDELPELLHSHPHQQGDAATDSRPLVLDAASLGQQFTTVLQSLGIPILYKTCEAELMGSYNYARNEITLCQNNVQAGSEDYLTTLAHESWHVIQDYATGLDNVLIAPVTWNADDHENLEAMSVSLDLNRMQTILNRYDDEDYAFEIEAYLMEEHPEIVLSILENLANP